MLFRSVDAIMDVTETGTTLRQNQLKIVDTVMESSAHLIANKKSLKDKQKRQKIFDIVTLMRGAVQGRKYLHIYMNEIGRASCGKECRSRWSPYH